MTKVPWQRLGVWGALSICLTECRRPPDPPRMGPVVDITAGGFHTCAIDPAHRVWCWGLNHSGQVGLRTSGSEVLLPTPVAGLAADVQALALGHEHTCALHRDGGVSCWGGNDAGQLGDGTTTGHPQPQRIAGLDGVVQLSASASLTCALRRDGRPWCFGELRNLRDGVRSAVPKPLEGMDGVAQIRLGPEHHCALMQRGTVMCWGSNLKGQVGDGTTVDRARPTTVQGLTDVIELAVGDGANGARLRDGTVRCWGFDRPLGVASGTDAVTTAAPVVGLRDVAQIVLGEHHLCARRTNGTVACWGDVFFSGVGDGVERDPSQRSVRVPIVLPGLRGVQHLTAGRRHTCALLARGTATCWGASYGGSLGDGTRQARAAPVAVRQ